MTRFQAGTKANALWAGRLPDGRIRRGLVIARTKMHVNRFEVGYHDEGTVTILGRGPTWEIAFDRAFEDERTRNEGSWR